MGAEDIVRNPKRVGKLLCHFRGISPRHRQQRIEKHDSVARLERPSLPGCDLVDHLVGNGRDQIREISMPYSSRTWPWMSRVLMPRVQSNDFVVEAREASEVLGD